MLALICSVAMASRLAVGSSRKLHYLVIDICLFRCIINIFHRCVRPSIAYVFLYSSVEDMVFLQDHSDIFAEEVYVIFAYVHSVKLD